jgi:hypothetical protein
MNGRTALMSGCHASTALTISLLHQTINIAFQKQCVDIEFDQNLMEIANLILLGHYSMDRIPVRNRCKQSENQNQFERMVKTNKNYIATKIIYD